MSCTCAGVGINDLRPSLLVLGVQGGLSEGEVAVDVASLSVKVSLAALPLLLGLGEVLDGDSDAFLDM